MLYWYSRSLQRCDSAGQRLITTSTANNGDYLIKGATIVQLLQNQSALILEADEHGEVSVNVATGNQDGLTAQICQAIAMKLMSDEDFQSDIMDMLEEGDF